MRKFNFLVIGLSITVLFACGSSSPSEDTVKESAMKILAAQFYLDRANVPLNEIMLLENWEVTNEYNKKVGDEKVYFYDIETDLKVKGWDGEKITDSVHDYGHQSGTIALVKRGKQWYLAQ
jgi:hypothetical protein